MSLTTTTKGLTSAEVEQRCREYGENALPSAKRTSAWGIFFNQFKNPLVYIILAAAGISLAIGEYGDFTIIMAVVLIDAVLGYLPLCNHARLSCRHPCEG